MSTEHCFIELTDFQKCLILSYYTVYFECYYDRRMRGNNKPKYSFNLKKKKKCSYLDGMTTKDSYKITTLIE